MADRNSRFGLFQILADLSHPWEFHEACTLSILELFFLVSACLAACMMLMTSLHCPFVLRNLENLCISIPWGIIQIDKFLSIVILKYALMCLLDRYLYLTAFVIFPGQENESRRQTSCPPHSANNNHGTLFLFLKKKANRVCQSPVPPHFSSEW